MTDRPVVVRSATVSDAEQLAVLGTQVWLDNYATSGIHPSIARYVLDTFTPDKFRAMAADPAQLILIAERGRHLIALAIVALDCPTAHCDSPVQAEIDRLYVQEPFCNAGIGAQLIAAIEAELRSRGVSAMWLEAWAGNERALHFYGRNGFDDAGTAFFELNGKQHENRVLVKRLKQRDNN
jgi:GNAT superfamily N-acetyltransferase